MPRGVLAAACALKRSNLDQPFALWDKALDRLSAADHQHVASQLKSRCYNAGELIFSQEEPGHSLYVVNSGKVRLYHTNMQGEEFTIGMWSKGYVLGLISSVLGECRFLSAECLEVSNLSVLSRQRLLRLMDELPRFSANIAYLIAYMAKSSLIDSSPLALDTATVRLGRLLVRISEVDVRSPDKSCLVVITQDQLGKMLGVSRSWVNTILSDFERRHLIRRERRRIVILDKNHFISKVLLS